MGKAVRAESFDKLRTGSVEAWTGAVSAVPTAALTSLQPVYSSVVGSFPPCGGRSGWGGARNERCLSLPHPSPLPQGERGPTGVWSTRTRAS